MSTEDNRFTARAARYVKVGANVGAVAAKVAGQRMLGLEGDRSRNAADLAAALGGLKGPIMKVAQMLATIPDAVPPEYAKELAHLQSAAPPMGPAFVRRRMLAELGPAWAGRFASFEPTSAASASLGQVHRATDDRGRQLAVKLQYPDMQSAVEADLAQLRVVFGIHQRMDPGIDTREIMTEIGARLREELDYGLEARHMRLYRAIFAGDPAIRVPEVVPELSTARLLAMTWHEGRPLLDYKTAPLEERNAIARAMFRAWWYPFSHYGVIHGDPHLGNYTVFDGPAAEWAAEGPAKSPAAEWAAEGSARKGINLLDYGCIRTFRPTFVEGVVDLYRGFLDNDPARVAHAYQCWGFKDLTTGQKEALDIWARFIYGPLLDDRERTIADGTSPAEYGRREAFTVQKKLREAGRVLIPREFVFMDRAAIGLGGVFLHLDARQNWCRLFNETIADFDAATVAARQREAFAAAGVPLPT